MTLYGRSRLEYDAVMRAAVYGRTRRPVRVARRVWEAALTVGVGLMAGAGGLAVGLWLDGIS